MDELTFVFDMDGNQVSCHIQGLDNLAEDPFGYGDSKSEALQDLMTRLGPDLN